MRDADDVWAGCAAVGAPGVAWRRRRTGRRSLSPALPSLTPTALHTVPPLPTAPCAIRSDVTASAPLCPQLKLYGDLLFGQEDCLYLQVTVPEAAAISKNVPVMVFIYGGAYILGDSEEFGLYDQKHLASTRNVIVVAMNYRLGP